MKKEIQTILNSKLLIATFVAVSILPLLYGALYLWAFWDPYNNIKNIPVAIVNNDTGARKADLTDSKIYHFGNEIVDELKKDTVMKWYFVDEEKARLGLQNKTYYTMVTIPNDFSQNILSVDSDNPRKATIIFVSRQSSSFMASKFSDSVFARFKAALNEKIGKEYLDNIFTESRKSTIDLSKAVDGSVELNDGLEKAKNGNSDLLDGSEKLGTGMYELQKGLISLSDGAKRLDDGFNIPQEGKANSFAEGIDKATSGSTILKNGTSFLLAGVTSLDSGISQTKLGVESLKSASKQGVDGLASAIQLLQQYSANHPEASQSAEFVQAFGTLQAVSSGQNQVYQGLTSLSGSIDTMKTGCEGLVTGSTQLSVGMEGLSAGLIDLKAGKDKLNSGVSDLKNGLVKAKDGNQELLNGLEKIKDGQKDLKDGLVKAKDGTQELMDKLSEAFQTAFNKTLPEKNEKQSVVMSAPVIIKDNSIDLVANNGTGFAPYFIPLSLWVGSMAMLFLIDFSPKKKNNSHSLFNKTILGFIVGIVQAVLLDTVLINALHLRVNHQILFFLFTILLSGSFDAIQIFLTLSFDLAGKFVSIVLLMLQLTSSAGTYPFETIPSFFQMINPFLPMTYAVSALKEIISGGNINIIRNNSIKVVVVEIIFLLLSFLYIIKPITLLISKIKYEKNHR